MAVLVLGDLSIAALMYSLVRHNKSGISTYPNLLMIFCLLLSRPVHQDSSPSGGRGPRGGVCRQPDEGGRPFPGGLVSV